MASSVDELYPHFEVWVDNSLLLEVYAEEEKGPNRIRIYRSPTDFDCNCAEFLQLIEDLNSKLSRIVAEQPPEE